MKFLCVVLCSKCLLSKYKLSKNRKLLFINFHSKNWFSKKKKEGRKDNKMMPLFTNSQIDKFQIQFLCSLDHTNNRITREEWNLVRLILEFSQTRESVFQRLRAVNRWLNFVSPNENCSLSVAIPSIIRPDRRWNVTEQSVLSLINYPPTRSREG